MTFIEKINKPYPQTLNRWKITFAVSLFIALFVIIFQPFGLQSVQVEYKGILLVGYGFITFIILTFNLFILTSLLPNIFNEDKWTVKKEILWVSWIVISISIGNYLVKP